MKITVVFDAQGKIQGASTGEEMLETDDGSEITFTLVPLPGQSIHELEVPDELGGLEADAYLAGLEQTTAVQGARAQIAQAAGA
jgi:hypothetical protein